MDQSPSWEANSHSASQETPRLLFIPIVHGKGKVVTVLVEWR
jgi:hypothetical protein